MSELRIITNHHWHPLLSGYELTEKERKDFDYIEDWDNDTFDRFFRYRGNVYDTQDFMRCEHGIFSGWDGYASDSFFSGVLARYNNEDDWEHDGYVQVALYLS